MVRFVYLMWLILLLSASGCAHVEPGNGEGQTAETGLLQALGGLFGKPAGIVDESSRDGPAGVEAVRGSVSQYMDQQEKEFHQRLAMVRGTSIHRVENNLAVSFQSDDIFGADSWEIRKDAAVELDVIAGLLRKYLDTRIEIGGYTDSIGSEAHNLQLSQRRAEAVAAVLSLKGVDAARMTTRGFGESGPVASNATEAGRQKNRRVTLFIIPKAI